MSTIAKWSVYIDIPVSGTATYYVYSQGESGDYIYVDDSEIPVGWVDSKGVPDTLDEVQELVDKVKQYLKDTHGVDTDEGYTITQYVYCIYIRMDEVEDNFCSQATQAARELGFNVHIHSWDGTYQVKFTPDAESTFEKPSQKIIDYYNAITAK